ncbi:MAG: hypothetical protein ABIY55_16000 [Kofleriaceae bacterium]
MMVRLAGLLAGIALTLAAAPTAAQPSQALSHASTDEPRPWAASVSEAEQATALALYTEGNHEFTESRFAQALARYRDAILHWDHPAIRFNMAVCLINLDQPLEARDQLDKSLVYGARPLGADAYSQGLTYRKLLDAQLSFVTIAMHEPGAQVTLDGKLLFVAPGELSAFQLPGEHQVSATRPGFVSSTTTLVLVAGKRTSFAVRPLEHATTTRTVRRWSPWLPWLVLAGGGVLVGAGALTEWAASHDFTSYDAAVAQQCPQGCTAAMLAELPALRDQKANAGHERDLAIGLVAAGGAVVIAATIGVIVNLPRVEIGPPRVRPTITPARGGATLSLVWGF